MHSGTVGCDNACQNCKVSKTSAGMISIEFCEKCNDGSSGIDGDVIIPSGSNL